MTPHDSILYMLEIKPHAVYTTEESQTLLRISNSTMKRLLKKGLIRANKIGKQYRILGHELLRLLSTDADIKATEIYQKVKKETKKQVEKW